MFTGGLLALLSFPKLLLQLLLHSAFPFSLPCNEARNSQDCPDTSRISVLIIFALPDTANNGDVSFSTWSVQSLPERKYLENVVSCLKNSSQYLGKEDPAASFLPEPDVYQFSARARCLPKAHLTYGCILFSYILHCPSPCLLPTQCRLLSSVSSGVTSH